MRRGSRFAPAHRRTPQPLAHATNGPSSTSPPCFAKRGPLPLPSIEQLAGHEAPRPPLCFRLPVTVDKSSMDANEQRLDTLREVESLAAGWPLTPISVLRAVRRERVAAEQSLARRGRSAERSASYRRAAITR
jgi:hypothetical protein